MGERVRLCEAHDANAREGDNVAVQVWVYKHAQFGCLKSVCVGGGLCACVCMCMCMWVDTCDWMRVDWVCM